MSGVGTNPPCNDDPRVMDPHVTCSWCQAPAGAPCQGDRFTQEEWHHLNMLIQNMHADLVMPEQCDPEYFRHLAGVASEGAFQTSHGYMHPDDCDSSPTSAELIEIAESLECGMQHGEFI